VGEGGNIVPGSRFFCVKGLGGNGSSADCQSAVVIIVWDIEKSGCQPDQISSRYPVCVGVNDTRFPLSLGEEYENTHTMTSDHRINTKGLLAFLLQFN